MGAFPAVSQPGKAPNPLAPETMGRQGFPTEGMYSPCARATLAQVDPAVRISGYFGYSIGIGFPPSWVERSVEIAVGRKDVREPGMTFHTHRVLRVPGLVGVGFSESIVITENGYEVLTGHPRRLIVL